MTPEPAPIVPIRQEQPSLPAPMSIQQLVEQTKLIQEAMRAVMKEGEHFGVIPGTKKPSLLKPGAEKLCLLCRLAPDYSILQRSEQEKAPYHIAYEIKCTLTHQTTGMTMGSGVGSCTSREAKYAFRYAERKCPKCGKAAIIKGKEEYGGGYVCFKKKDGCGAKFGDKDPAITSQQEKTPTEDVSDQHNTILKMACKRALVAAVLNVTAASDIFTQDLEDLKQEARKHAEDEEAEGGPRADVPHRSAKQGRDGVAAQVVADDAPTAGTDQWEGHGAIPIEGEEGDKKPTRYVAPERGWWSDPIEPGGHSWKHMAEHYPEVLVDIAVAAGKKHGRRPTEEDDAGWSEREISALRALERFNVAPLEAARAKMKADLLAEKKIEPPPPSPPETADPSTWQVGWAQAWVGFGPNPEATYIQLANEHGAFALEHLRKCKAAQPDMAKWPARDAKVLWAIRQHNPTLLQKR